MNPNTFSPAQLAALRTAYAPIKTAGVEHLPRLHKLFDQCSDDALLQLVRARINFVSKLALNAAMRRGLAIPDLSTL